MVAEEEGVVGFGLLVNHHQLDHRCRSRHCRLVLGHSGRPVTVSRCTRTNDILQNIPGSDSCLQPLSPMAAALVL